MILTFGRQRLGARARVFAALSLLTSSGCRPHERRVEHHAQPDYPELVVADPWFEIHVPRALSDRGKLIGVAHAATFSKDDLDKNPLFQLALDSASNGFELFVMQYVSVIRPHVAGVVTALVYLPSGSANDVITVALEHGGSGMGPQCGPSHVGALTDPIALPLVGRGYAVMAPDFAGMGVDNGLSSFLVGQAEADATLDGIKALRQLDDSRFRASRLGKDLFIIGHSQGGHAALMTQQLFAGEGEMTLLGSVEMAPALGSARQWSSYFNDPSRLVGGMEVSAAMSLYAHAIYAGGPSLETWLSERARLELPPLFHDRCLPGLIGDVASRFRTVGELYQPSFIAAARRCSFERVCSDFEPWSSELLAEEPARIVSSAPTLIFQGLADQVVEPRTVGCIVERLRKNGTPVEACALEGADHLSVIPLSVEPMLKWMSSRAHGELAKVCAAPLAARCGL